MYMYGGLLENTHYLYLYVRAILWDKFLINPRLRLELSKKLGRPKNQLPSRFDYWEGL